VLVVNLFAGPGTGKTTTAVGLFHELKRKGINAEFVPEFVKEHEYAEEWSRIKDQLYILANQHHKIFLLKDKVDVVITDSPLLLSMLYGEERDEYIFNSKEFKDYVVSLHESYDSVNIFLERVESNGFQENGRMHDLETSLEYDEKIKDTLRSLGEAFECVKVDDDVIKNCLNIIHSRR